MKNLAIIVLSLLLSLSCKQNNSQNSDADAKTETSVSTTEIVNTKKQAFVAQTITDSIAEAYGFKNWNKIKELQFTFNVDRGETHSERSWIWKPQEQEVTMMTATDSITYIQTQVDNTSMAADQAFINDRYWLLAPFHLAWDDFTTTQTSGKVEAPISKEPMNKVTIVYGDQGGYTPGDAYDLFYDNAYHLKEWIFRKGNATEPSMITTWEEPVNEAGITMQTKHQNAEGNFELYFTNVVVK